MQMHTITKKNDVSLDKEFHQNLYKEHHKDSVIDQGKQKIFSERKWIVREYHVQDNADVVHKYVKMYCNTNQFPELPFCGPHYKTHGTRDLINHYHFHFDPKLGKGVRKMRH